MIDWPRFPCYGLDGALCRCSKGAACTSPGKHPAVAQWRQAATTDPAQVEAWATAKADQWALAVPEGFVVLDVDPRNGGSLAALAELGELPPTWTQATGGGGYHLMYRCPVKLPGPVPGVAGVDVKQHGGYIMAPGAKHCSGAEYVVLADLDPAPAPLWLVALAVPDRAPAEPDWNDEPASQEAVARCTAYLDQVPSGVGQTWAAALACWSFGLNLAQRVEALTRWDLSKWPRPWAPEQIRRKAVEAAKSDRPKGWRLTEDATAVGSALQAMASKVTASEHAASTLPGWEARMTTTQTKYGPVIMINSANVALVFAQHPLWGCLAYDEFGQRARWAKSPPFDLVTVPAGTELCLDTDYVHAQRWLTLNYARQGLGNVPKGVVQDALVTAAKMASYHPVRELFDGLQWDGVPRLDQWLSTYLGATDDPAYLAAYGRTWLLSAVRRIYEPGCQADVMLVLEGAQGTFKSSALRTLALRNQWFDDQLGDLADKDTALRLAGLLIVEHAELASLRRSDVEEVRAFVSRRVDRYRAPYERSTVDHPRQCVFAGSTNSDRYFVDHTGSRRFAPVRCGAIQLTRLREDREQLWAEAVARYNDGEETWVSDAGVVRLAEEAQEERFDSDPWEDLVAQWLEAPPGAVLGQPIGPAGERREVCTMADLWTAVGVPADRRDELRGVANIRGGQRFVGGVEFG